MAFLAVWFIGDINNLIGALWAGLVPTVIAIAIYFCFADLILISQCIYYNMKNARRSQKALLRAEDRAESPLLGEEIRAILAYLEVIGETQLPVVGAEQAPFLLSWIFKRMDLNGSRIL